MSKETVFLKQLFDAALTAVDPGFCVPPHLPDPPPGRTVVVGAGKAAASMASAVEQNWRGDLSGLVITRYGHSIPCDRVEVIEAGHPVPDETGTAAAERMVRMVSGLVSEDLVLTLISGGGSSLLSLPAPGITLQDKQAVNRALLRSGANISEMNCVRKHLSAIKGGRLAGFCVPAAVTTLVISDVPGDDPSTVASGPTLPDTSTRQDALKVLERYEIAVSAAVREHLDSPRSETPKPGDPVFSRAGSVVVANAAGCLARAGDFARARDITVVTLGDDLEGEARELGRAHGSRVRKLRESHGAPLLILSGGETTVTVTGDGRGGRNVEYLLGLTIELDAMPDVYALAADTDGIDGTEDNAGALITPSTLARAHTRGMKAPSFLQDNNAYNFFRELGDLLVTGPTLTNVNDFRAIYIAA